MMETSEIDELKARIAYLEATLKFRSTMAAPPVLPDPPSERIDALVSQFNGAIKYVSMLKDHPDWSDDECIAFARKGHEQAIAQLKEAMRRDKAGEGHWHNQVPVWNDRIPYCRNQPTLAMIEEAMK